MNGTITQCLSDLKTKVENSSLVKRCVYSVLNNLLGLGDGTLLGWLTGTLPKGQRLFELRLVLRLLGYNLDECRGMSTIQTKLADAFAMGVLTNEKVCEYTGAAENSVMRWATGKVMPIEDRYRKLEELLSTEDIRDSFEEKYRYWSERVNSLGLRNNTTGVVVLREEVRSNPNPSIANTNNDMLINTLGQMIKTMIPLAKSVCSDAFSAEERKFLRVVTSTGHTNGVFELSNLLNALCSEKARSSNL